MLPEVRQTEHQPNFFGAKENEICVFLDVKEEVELTISGNDITITDKGKDDLFNFADPILEYRTQKETMIFVGEPICDDLEKGYNSSLICFGNRKSFVFLSHFVMKVFKI